MENASKALIIAGAILVSILLIGLGVGLISALNGPLNSGTATMNESTVQMYNSKIEKYIGTQNGANVRSLLSTIQTMNTNNTNQISVFNGTATTATALATFINSINTTKNYKVEIKAYATTGYISQVKITAL